MNLLELIKGTPTPTRPGALIELQNPSLRITLAGAIEISRLGLTPQPPMHDVVILNCKTTMRIAGAETAPAV